MKLQNSFAKDSVMGPGLPAEMVWPSKFVIGMISAVVTAVKSSSADLAWSEVMDCSTISIPSLLAAKATYFRVMDGKMLAERGVVYSFLFRMAKKADAEPSVINPDSLTSIASEQPFLAASRRAITLASRFSDLMSQRFHRQSGCVETLMPSFLRFGFSGSCEMVRKKLGVSPSKAA